MLCGRLLAIPRALAPQALGQALQLEESRRRLLREALGTSARSSASAVRRSRRRGRGRRRRVARLVRDLALEVASPSSRARPSTPSASAALEVRLDLRLDLGERLRVGRLDRAERLDDVPAVDAVHRAEISFVLSENAALSNGATVCVHAPLVPPCATQSLPPCAAEPVSFEYFFASAAKLAPFFSFCLDLLGEALAVDEDVPHLARLGRRERRLVLRCSTSAPRRRHLDVRRHLRLQLLS